MYSAFTLYILLVLLLSLTYFNSLFFYASFFVLISPLIFKDLKELGLKNYRSGILYGSLLSSVYLPFIWNSISIQNFYQSGQFFAEEIFFRGYLLSTVPVKNIHLRNITVSVLFSLPHVIINPDILSVLTFFPSLIFGYLYIRSGSVIAPFIFHLFSNIFFQQYLIHKL